jgi:hypothetical protein
MAIDYNAAANLYHNSGDKWKFGGTLAECVREAMKIRDADRTQYHIIVGKTRLDSLAIEEIPDKPVFPRG